MISVCFSKPCCVMRIVHWVRPFRQGPEGSLVLQGKVANSFIFNSKDSLTEFVLNKRSASHFAKPFLALRRWREEKCVYWNVSVGSHYVLKSRIFLSINLCPVKTSVSRKTIFSDDISRLNLKVA